MGSTSRGSIQLALAVEKPINLKLENGEDLQAEVSIDDRKYKILEWPAEPITIPLSSEGAGSRILRCTFWLAGTLRQERRRCMETVVPQDCIEDLGQPIFQLWLGLMHHSDCSSVLPRFGSDEPLGPETARNLFRSALESARLPSQPKFCLTVAIVPLSPTQKPCGTTDLFMGLLNSPVMQLLKHSGEIIKKVSEDHCLAERDLALARRELSSKEGILRGQVASLLGHKRAQLDRLQMACQTACQRWLSTDNILLLQRAYYGWLRAVLPKFVLRTILPNLVKRAVFHNTSLLKTVFTGWLQQLPVNAVPPVAFPPAAFPPAAYAVPGSAMLSNIRAPSGSIRIPWGCKHSQSSQQDPPQQHVRSLQQRSLRLAPPSSHRQARRAGMNLVLALMETGVGVHLLHVLFYKWSEEATRSQKADLEALLLADKQRASERSGLQLASHCNHRRRLRLQLAFCKWGLEVLKAYKADMEDLLLNSHRLRFGASNQRVEQLLRSYVQVMSRVLLPTCWQSWRRMASDHRHRRALLSRELQEGWLLVALALRTWAKMRSQAQSDEALRSSAAAFATLARRNDQANFLLQRCALHAWTDMIGVRQLRCVSAVQQKAAATVASKLTLSLEAMLAGKLLQAWRNSTALSQLLQCIGDLREHGKRVLERTATCWSGRDTTSLLQGVVRAWQCESAQVRDAAAGTYAAAEAAAAHRRLRLSLHCALHRLAGRLGERDHFSCLHTALLQWRTIAAREAIGRQHGLRVADLSKQGMLLIEKAALSNEAFLLCSALCTWSYETFASRRREAHAHSEGRHSRAVALTLVAWCKETSKVLLAAAWHGWLAEIISQLELKMQTSRLQDQVQACARDSKDLARRAFLRLSFTGLDLGVHVALRAWRQTAHHARLLGQRRAHSQHLAGYLSIRASIDEKLSLLNHAFSSWRQNASNAELERDLQGQLAALAGNKQCLLQSLEARWSRDVARWLLQDVVRWWSAAAMQQSSDRTSSRERGERELLKTATATKHKLLKNVVGRVLHTSETGGILALSLQGWLSAMQDEKRGRDHERAVATLSEKLVAATAQATALEDLTASKDEQQNDHQQAMVRQKRHSMIMLDRLSTLKVWDLLQNVMQAWAFAKQQDTLMVKCFQEQELSRSLLRRQKDRVQELIAGMAAMQRGTALAFVFSVWMSMTAEAALARAGAAAVAEMHEEMLSSQAQMNAHKERWMLQASRVSDSLSLNIASACVSLAFCSWKRLCAYAAKAKEEAAESKAQKAFTKDIIWRVLDRRSAEDFVGLLSTAFHAWCESKLRKAFIKDVVGSMFDRKHTDSIAGLLSIALHAWRGLGKEERANNMHARLTLKLKEQRAELQNVLEKELGRTASCIQASVWTAWRLMCFEAGTLRQFRHESDKQRETVSRQKGLSIIMIGMLSNANDFDLLQFVVHLWTSSWQMGKLKGSCLQEQNVSLRGQKERLKSMIEGMTATQHGTALVLALSIWRSVAAESALMKSGVTAEEKARGEILSLQALMQAHQDQWAMQARAVMDTLTSTRASWLSLLAFRLWVMFRIGASKAREEAERFQLLVGSHRGDVLQGLKRQFALESRAMLTWVFKEWMGHLHCERSAQAERYRNQSTRHKLDQYMQVVEQMLWRHSKVRIYQVLNAWRMYTTLANSKNSICNVAMLGIDGTARIFTHFWFQAWHKALVDARCISISDGTAKAAAHAARTRAVTLMLHRQESTADLEILSAAISAWRSDTVDARWEAKLGRLTTENEARTESLLERSLARWGLQCDSGQLLARLLHEWRHEVARSQLQCVALQAEWFSQAQRANMCQMFDDRLAGEENEKLVLLFSCWRLCVSSQKNVVEADRMRTRIEELLRKSNVEADRMRTNIEESLRKSFDTALEEERRKLEGRIQHFTERQTIFEGLKDVSATEGRLHRLHRTAVYELLQRSAMTHDLQHIRTSLISWHKQVVVAKQQRMHSSLLESFAAWTSQPSSAFLHDLFYAWSQEVQQRQLLERGAAHDKQVRCLQDQLANRPAELRKTRFKELTEFVVRLCASNWQGSVALHFSMWRGFAVSSRLNLRLETAKAELEGQSRATNSWEHSICMVEKLLSLRSVSLNHEILYGTFMQWHAHATQEAAEKQMETHSVVSAESGGFHQVCGRLPSPDAGGQVEWQAESPCNHPPTVTVDKDGLQRRLLFTLLSAQDSTCSRACVAAWREYVDNQQRLEFRDARLRESRRMSNLADAACMRWQKWEHALLLSALLHHWSSSRAGFSQGSNVVQESSPSTNFRSLTLQRVLLSPHSKRVKHWK